MPLYHHQMGTPIEIGGAGDGTKADPFYWYGLTLGQTAAVDNTGTDPNDNYKLYLRIKLSAGIEYTIGESRPNGRADGKIWLYSENGTEIKSDDGSSRTIAGVSCSDSFTYTPTTTGVFIVGAGVYSDRESPGPFTVAMDPAPESDPVPTPEVIYPTSTGFDEYGHPLRFDSSRDGDCGAVRIPENGMVLYAPLNAAASAAETGQQISSYNATYVTLDGIDCVRVGNTSPQATLAIPAATLPGGASERTVSLFVNTDTRLDGPNAIYGMFMGYGASDYDRAFMLGVEVFSQYGNNISWTLANPTNIWHHVLATYDGTTVKAYVDGTLVGALAFSLNTSLDYPLYLGCTERQRVYQGIHHLAALRIYNRVLTDMEIERLSNELKPR